MKPAIILSQQQVEDYAFFRKCGEITASSSAQCFGLNCLFCPGICLQFDVFIQHIRDHHHQDIQELYFDQPAQKEVDKVKNPNESNWNELESAAEQNRMRMGVEMQPEEEPQEEVGLVYIMESALPGELEEGEETVDPFEMLNGGGGWNEEDGGTHKDDEGEKEAENLSSTSNEEIVQSAAPIKTNLPEKSKTKEKKFITTPTMREVVRNREIICYLLEAYKNNAKLWNPNNPQYKYNANRSMYNELSAPLKRDLDCTLSGSEIFAIIKGFRCRYRRELTKIKDRKGKHKTRLWYFEKLDFLRDVIENKRAQKAAKDHADSTENDESPESVKITQNRKILSFLLEAFKNHEPLWNSSHANYLKCNKGELFDNISSQLLESLNVSMTGEKCFIEIQKLRTRYRKELHLVNKRKSVYAPKLWCFEQMSFMRKMFEDQIVKRLNKKGQGVYETKTKTKTFLKSEPIVFQNTDEHMQFIEIYRNYSALWDVDHPDYRSVTYRNKALNQMLEELNVSLDTNATIEQLQKTLYQLRKEFSTEKQKQLACDDDDECDDEVTTTTTALIYGKLAEFLEPNLGPFRCETCHTLIKTSDQFKLHRSGHDGTHPFICTLCGKGFQIPGNLTIHIRRHKRDFPYACEVCDKRFATSTEVAIHMRTHTGERPYICDLCGKSFKTWSFFDIHRRTHLKQSTFHCPICDKGFYEKCRFTDHMNGHLNIRKHLCNVCGKSFTTYGNLKKHNELHLPVKKYKCTLCGKRFAQFASVRWHKRKTHQLHAQEPMEQ